MNYKRNNKPVARKITFRDINVYFTKPEEQNTSRVSSLLSKLCPPSSKNNGESVDNSQLIDDGKINHLFSEFKFAFDWFIQNPLGTQLEEFCITLNTINQNKNYLEMHNEVSDYMKRWCKRNEDLKPIYLLVAELNKSGMIHWHGVITFTWPEANTYFHIARFKDSLRKKFGRTVGKEVFSPKKYLEYISKDQVKVPYAPLTNVPRLKPLSREATP